MKILFLYDYQPENPKFPCTGFQYAAYNYTRELRKLGHEVDERNIFITKNYDKSYDFILIRGFWGELGYVQETNIPVVPYITSDGVIPKQYIDIIEKLTLIA